MAIIQELGSMLPSNQSTLLLVALGFWVSYKLVVYLQRLYFHPLSHVPGPKLCAASRLYEFYWDSIQQGRLWAKLPELHARYGPIIRLGPNEVHIQDAEYFDTLFGFRPLDKDAMAAKQFGMQHALFATEDYKTYTRKRAAFGDAFSRSKTLRLVSLVHEQVEKACKLIRETAGRGGKVDLAYIFRATPAEVITQYLFGEKYGFLEDVATTKSLYDKRMDNLMGLTHLGRFIDYRIPLILSLLRQQFKKLVGYTEPGAAFMSYYFFASKQVSKVVEAHAHPEKSTLISTPYPIVFDDFLRSSLPASEKRGAPLTEQAMAVWSGGWDTVGSTLTIAAHHALANPRIASRLRDELRRVWPSLSPSSSPPPTVREMEAAPYLDGIVREALRFSPGQLCRLCRVAPAGGERYSGFVIPAGTTISMSLYDVGQDRSVWGDDAAEFRPERWIEDGEKKLDRYLVAFSKGARVCPGQELAWVEIKIVLATLFRRFRMRIPEEEGVTLEGDVAAYYDGITLAPRSWAHRLPVRVEVEED